MVLITALLAACVAGMLLVYLERARPRPRQFMPVVVLAALAVVGRMLFVAIPNFQPATAVIIICGVYFGAYSGALCGVLVALVSNLLLGQGLWTPWQMLAWGGVGLGAGLLFCRRSDRAGRSSGSTGRTQGSTQAVWTVCVYGVVASLAYGMVMDTQYFFSFLLSGGWAAYGTALAAGALFNLAHAVSTAVFLALALKPWGRKIQRLITTYDLSGHCRHR
ncbi:MAG: ECF transporter S component [Actinomycetes bacterium]|jgi:uncharacterized membrane protein|nr:ECF transporter S component [Actinomycetes bacterium]